jgi:branched-chain amino acid transport system substrate-binding protein
VHGSSERFVNTGEGRLMRAVLGGLVVAVALAMAMPASAGEKLFKIGGLAALQQGFGRSMQSGAQVAVDEINAAGGVNGYKMQITWLDDETSPATGRTLAQRLIFNDKVDAILGCHASTVVLAIADLMAQNKILEVAMGSAQKVTELNNPWIVRVRENDLLTGKVLVNYMVDKANLKKVAIIYMSEQYGMGGRDNLVTALAAKGLKPVAAEAHNQGDKDFSSQLLNVKKAGADALVLISGVPDLGIMVKQARQLIPDVKIFMSSVGATKPFMDVAGEAANGTFAVVTYTEDNPNPAVQKFVQAFKAKHNSPPFDFFSALSYDAVYMLAQATKKAGTPDQHEKMRDAFKEIKGYNGATGLTYDVDKNGESVHELLLITYENMKHKVVAKVSGR